MLRNTPLPVVIKNREIVAWPLTTRDIVRRFHLASFSIPDQGDERCYSIVLLIENLLPIPAQRLQQTTVRADHLIESADVGVHIGPIADDSRQMVLHISTQ